MIEEIYRRGEGPRIKAHHPLFESPPLDLDRLLDNLLMLNSVLSLVVF